MCERECVRERARVCVCERECVCESERECVSERDCVCERECVRQRAREIDIAPLVSRRVAQVRE